MSNVIAFIVSNPYIFSFKVNFGIFLKILRMLISKLKAQQMSFHDYKYRYVIKKRKEVLALSFFLATSAGCQFALADYTFAYHHQV